MDTVRLARDLGDVSGLLPTGISRLREVPFQLLVAIRSALIFLSFEEMRAEDQPPRSIWTDSELLNAHMENVKRKWREGNPGGEDTTPAKRNDVVRTLIVG